MKLALVLAILIFGGLVGVLFVMPRLLELRRKRIDRQRERKREEGWRKHESTRK